MAAYHCQISCLAGQLPVYMEFDLPRSRSGQLLFFAATTRGDEDVPLVMDFYHIYPQYGTGMDRLWWVASILVQAPEAWQQG